MWRSSRRWLPLCLLALAAVASAQPMPGTVIDLASGQRLDEAAFVKRAANARGCCWANATTWPVTTPPSAGCCRRCSGSVHRALVLEMIASERQPRLQRVQRWLAKGNQAEGARLQELLDWDTRWPWAAYGGLVQDATAAGIPAVRRQPVACRGQRAAGLHRRVRFPVPTARQRLSAVVLAQHADAAPMLEGMLAVQQARDTRMAQVLTAALHRRCWWPAAGMYCAAPACRATCHRRYAALVIALASPGETVDAADADLLWVLDDE
jgi:uncharacterized iron-regulated protein